MKLFLTFILFVSLVTYVGIELYQRAFPEDLEESDNAIEDLQVRRSFPDIITLESSDGREMEVRLLGRNSDQIQFMRLSDGEEFVHPINTLSTQSQDLVYTYRETRITGASKLFREGRVTLETAHIEQLKEAILRINEKITALKARYKVTGSKTERRTIYREIEELLKERDHLQFDLDSRTD